jgi:hypothetical protein
MAEPLEQVRAKLGIQPAPAYVQLRNKDMLTMRTA